MASSLESEQSSLTNGSMNSGDLFNSLMGYLHPQDKKIAVCISEEDARAFLNECAKPIDMGFIELSIQDIPCKVFFVIYYE